MTAELLPVCMSCHTAVNTEEPAVFRSGVRIAPVRCWKLKDAAKPLRPVKEQATQDDPLCRAAPRDPRPSMEGASPRLSVRLS
jgi:hypothetical protein